MLEMKRLIALFLVISFLGMNCATYERGKGINLELGQKPGAVLVIQEKDGQQVRGELVVVKQDSLVLKERDSGADVTVDVRDIQVVIINTKSKVLLGAGLGFLTGAVVGGLYGAIVHPLSYRSNFYFVQGFYLGAIGAGIGLLIGGVLGLELSEDKKIQLGYKSDSEIKEILKELRKKARVPNFQ